MHVCTYVHFFFNFNVFFVGAFWFEIKDAVFFVYCDVLCDIIFVEEKFL